MNKTVELVNEWAAFEQKHPKNSVEDFCRYYLINNREKENKKKLFEGNVTPPRTDLVMLKLMGRIIKMFEVYVDDAIKGIGIKKPEEFYFLNYIFQMKNPKKTEVIYADVCELSTGLAILEQLKRSDFIKEKDDTEDKRSKRLSTTAKGEKVLYACYDRFGKVGEMMFGDMADEDRQLCIQLLQGVDNKHINLWQQYKGKPFDETYKALCSKN